MTIAIRESNALITIGWKGADAHFTQLLSEEGAKINEVHVISPKADTLLGEVFPKEMISKVESTFLYYVGDSPAFESTLTGFTKGP